MKLHTLQDCFGAKLMALYDIEHEIVKALPKMIKKATNPKLKEALNEHLTETEDQIERLEQIFEIVELKPKKLRVEAIRGLIEDDKWSMDQDTTDATLDSLIIAGGRYVEHFEMAGYMSLLEWSRILELKDAEMLIEETLEEERNAEGILTEIAEEINLEAQGAELPKGNRSNDDPMDDTEDEEITDDEEEGGESEEN